MEEQVTDSGNGTLLVETNRSKVHARLWIVERGQKKKRYSKQGSRLSKGTEGTHGGELGDHGASLPLRPLILTFYAVP